MFPLTHSLKQKTATILLIALLCSGLFVGDAQALTVSPVRIELAGDPGTTITGEFLLINEQPSQQLFYLSSENFEARGEEGSPTFVASTEGLASWVSTTPSVRLAGGEKKKVQFKVAIPVNADPGGHFAAIFAGTGDPASAGEGGQVSVGAKIGVLILLRVNGDVAEGGGLLSFEGEGRLVSGLPIKFNYRFQNTGGDRLRPIGEIAISNTIGMTTTRVVANPSEGNVLPASTRKFSAEWVTTATSDDDQQIIPAKKEEDAKGGFWGAVRSQWSNFTFGVYSAHLNLSYGTSELKEANATYRFFILPWQLLLVIACALAVLFFGGRSLLRRYNRWIIEQAKRS